MEEIKAQIAQIAKIGISKCCTREWVPPRQFCTETVARFASQAEFIQRICEWVEKLQRHTA